MYHAPTRPGYRSPTKVLSAAATGAASLFQEYHGDVDSIFGVAGIDPCEVDDPVNELNLGQFCKLFEVAARRTGNDNIGLEFGHGFQPRHLGALGFAAISSPTLASALRNLEMFFPAHQGKTQFSLSQDSEVLWLRYRIYDERIEQRRQDAELSLGMFCNIFREALGPQWAPLEVRFEHARPDGHKDHEKCFGAPVKFGRQTNALAFLRRDLDARMPNPDPYLFSMVRSFLESRQPAKHDAEAFAAWIRTEICSRLGRGLPTFHDVAEYLGLPESVFQQQLKLNNVAFSDIQRAARQELAMHYLGNPDMTLSEIAYALGYSELSAFSRAFRSWTGTSPQRYRRGNDLRA
ncbi:MAG: AraC family transcriptional regulator [Rhodobacteraceae bacterium]|nr:AraC family transcriptional regulator [Paracoccaceae bacterium]MCP5341096.1 AraC family transcriptional regulator [Paracoccaceae bacterium]